MTTIKLYHKHKAGEVSKEAFLYEVRRDSNLPWITNVTSYDDAVKILKNKGIISEAEMHNNEAKGSINDPGLMAMRAKKDAPKLQSPQAKKANPNKSKINTLLKKRADIERDMEQEAEPEGGPIADMYGDMLNKIDQAIAKLSGQGEWGPETNPYMDKDEIEARAAMIKELKQINEVDANVATDPAVDRVNPYFLKRGVMKLLAKEKELTNDSYINALNKAAKQLLANPHAFDEDMFANAKDVEKADSKLKTQEVKKNNHIDKANEMKKVKAKSLKESTIDELVDYLKKKELVNEDVHYEYHVGSEVHTPNGPGKVVEIVGSTLTVEREDGVLEDVQINTARHYTQEAQEEPSTEFTQDEPVAQEPEPSVADMWANWKGKPFSGMVVDPEYQSDLDKKYGKVREYIAKNKHDKEKMAKLKETLKKLKEAGEKTALVTTTSGQTTAVDYKTDDELKSLGDNSDIRSLKTGGGKKVKGN